MFVLARGFAVAFVLFAERTDKMSKTTEFVVFFSLLFSSDLLGFYFCFRDRFVHNFGFNSIGGFAVITPVHGSTILGADEVPFLVTGSSDAVERPSHNAML